MKIIIDTATGLDNVSAVVASSEDPSFPVANLRDDFTTNLWKATTTTATLTVQVAKGQAVALFNTNATSAVITAGSGESYANESGYQNESGYSYPSDEVSVSGVYNLPGVRGNLWADYALFAGAHEVRIALTATDPVYAGIVRAGNVEEFKDPAATGFSEGSKDYSIEKELNNGADYFRKRNIVKTFDGLSLFETRENAYKFKHDIWDMVGPKPQAIYLVSDAIQEKEFIGFMKREGSPVVNYSGSGVFCPVTFGLKEVI